MRHSHQSRCIPDSFALTLYEYLESQGITAEQVLDHPRPSPTADAFGSMPIELWSHLLQRAASHLNDPQLGLRLGCTISARHTGILGYLLMASQTLEEALTQIHKYQRLIYDVTPMVVRRRNTHVDLVWDAEHGCPGALVDETAITALVQFCRNLADEQIRPIEVHFVNPYPDNIRPYLDYFGCPVSFAQPETIVRLERSALQTHLSTADPAMLKLMQQQADVLLSELPEVPPIVDQVRRLIGRMLHERELGIEPVSRAMNMSPRTMQRRRKEADTCLRDEIAAVREEIAKRYLKETRLPIVDIAILLGYSEHSAFTRSFIRWTGQTPNHFRRQSRAG